MGRAILASAAVSGLVLPVAVDGVIATDGGWVRNFPLEHAYRNPQVDAIAAFRYVASYPPTDIAFLGRHAGAPRPLPRRAPGAGAPRRDPPRRGAGRHRGEPAHYGEMIVRLMRVAIARNTVLEERLADDRETSVAALQRLREDVDGRGDRRRACRGAGAGSAPSWTGSSRSARFPFRHDRHVPTLDRAGDPGEDGLDPTFRGDEPWPEERKRALIERGYRLTDDALAAGRRA